MTRFLITNTWVTQVTCVTVAMDNGGDARWLQVRATTAHQKLGNLHFGTDAAKNPL